MIAEFDGPSIAMAHRKELIAQISRGLAAEGVEHAIIAPPPTIRTIATNNAHSFGRSFVSPGARAAVASVDSLKNIDPRWAATKKLLVMDEGHHVLENNKWGAAALAFPNAAITGWTATAERGDGQGLGRHSDGLYTELVIGPTMRELIDAGHLSDYKIYATPTAGLDLSKVTVSKGTGDFSQKQLREVMAASEITGDVVGHYKRLAMGRLGLTFVTDVKAAEAMAEAYNAAGVPAAVLSAKTKPVERAAAIRRFGKRELLQIVNVDLLFEGFDLSAAAGMDVCVEVISMARPTHSFVLYAQMFGRVLRIAAGKGDAIIIDHVGNVIRHLGPPDFPRPISLDPRARKSRAADDDVPPVRQCGGCGYVYLKELGNCPDCNHVYKPAERSTPAEVDGDLTELDPGVLAELRSQAERTVWGEEKTRAYYAAKGLGDMIVSSQVKRQRETTAAQVELRHAIASVAGQWRAEGLPDKAIYVRFYVRYGVDVATACTLKLKESLLLLEKLK